MHFLIFALISALFAALVNFLDKYLIEKYLKGAGIGSLILFSALIGLPVMFLIWIFNPNVFSIHPTNAIIIIVSGMTYVLWVLLYLYALEKDEASVVSPLFQLSSVFSYILGFLFLKEILNINQIVGSILIFVGALSLNLKLTQKKTIYINKRVLLLMTAASLLVAANSLLFKFVAIEETFWKTSFWEYFGFVLMAVILFATVKPYRKQFLNVINTNKGKVIGLNVFGEGINIVSKTAFNFATLLGPLALASFVSEGFQPIFVVILGVILTILFPKYIKENLEREYLTRKILSILIIFMGALILYLSE